MASNDLKTQKDFYKTHLEFLGFNVEEDPEDDQELLAVRDSRKILCRVFTKGIRLMEIYGTAEYAKNNRQELLEFLNTANGAGVAKYSTNTNGSSFFITLFLLSPYEKITFGNFVDLFIKEVDKVGDMSNADKLLF
jgi:hypothetical protein